MNWIEAAKQSHPINEGWYLVLYRFDNNELLPLPLYYQFAWNIPQGIYGAIEYYTPIDDLPENVTDGRVF